MLSLCKGFGIQVDKHIRCRIVKVENECLYKYKGVRMQGMDVVFQTNISLADFVGLGKGVSIGHGVVKRMKTNNEKTK